MGSREGEATRDENYPFESAKVCGWALPTRDSSRKSLGAGGAAERVTDWALAVVLLCSFDGIVW